MLINIGCGMLRASMLRIRGTVTSAADGSGLARTIILYDADHREAARSTTSRSGAGEFLINGSAGDRWTVLAVGRNGECDAVSCPISVEPL